MMKMPDVPLKHDKSVTDCITKCHLRLEEDREPEENEERLFLVEVVVLVVVLIV